MGRWFLDSVIRFIREKTGDSAIEFALIATLFLVPLFFGVVEVSNLLSADRRVSRLASSVADLVAQCDQVTQADLMGVMNLSTTILAPLPVDDELLEMRVSSVIPRAGGGGGGGVVADDDDDDDDDDSPPASNATVAWSAEYADEANRLPPLANGAAFPVVIPDGLLQAGSGNSSVVVAEVSYLYRPTIANLFGRQFQLDDIHYNAPRRRPVQENLPGGLGCFDVVLPP